MSPKQSTVSTLVVLSLFLFACSGQPRQGTPPQAPATPIASSATPAKSTTQPSTAPTERASEPPIHDDTATSETTPEPSPTPEPVTTPRFSPLDILTGEGTAFLLDYNNSTAVERANNLCHEQVSITKEQDTEQQQAQKLEACRAKERAKLTADVLRFRRDERGNGTVSIYRRSGSALVELYSASVKYEEAAPNLVKVIVKGNSSGSRPICRDRQNLEVKVPNSYSIELEDSVYGRLPYDAKIGLVGR